MGADVPVWNEDNFHIPIVFRKDGLMKTGDAGLTAGRVLIAGTILSRES